MSNIILCLYVPGRPAPQPRPRVFRGGGVKTDSKASLQWKRAIRQALKGTAWTPAAAGEPLVVDIHLTMPVADRRRHGCPHTGRPDFDNLAKSICDALEDAGVLAGDGQIVDAFIRKRYGAAPGGASIYVSRWSPELDS